jgi:hypothetical protein
LSERAVSAIKPGVKQAGRYLSVAIAIFAWIAICNHCALGAVASTTKQQIAQSHCPFHSTPAKKKDQPIAQQCCKILRAVVAKLAKSWGRDDACVSHVDRNIDQLVIFPASRNVAPLLLDTGPPLARSFAESVLQQSLLAHAPPFLA